MKKFIIMCSVLILILTLSACGKNTESQVIEIESYNLSSLSTCMGKMLDNDDGTVCTQEYGDALLEAYASHFIQDIDPQVKNV